MKINRSLQPKFPSADYPYPCAIWRQSREDSHLRHCISSLATRKKKAAPFGAAFPIKPRISRRIIPQSRPLGSTRSRFPPLLLFFCYAEVTVLG